MDAYFTQSVVISMQDIGAVLLERSVRAKRLNITVRPFRGVRVAVPKGVSFKKAEQIASAKSEWIKVHLDKMKEFEKLYESISVKKVTINRKEARELLLGRLDELANKHGYSYKRASVRNQRTRWGSCSSKNNISLNIKLTLLPDILRDYIILHELVHTKIKNHKKQFWAELLRAEPKAMELDKRMNQHNILLL